MANNIYRREPIVHKLPAYFSDMESVGYINLSNINGLRLYDNPLAAEQNSTYSCKNVFTDELGNLTVRPALLYNKQLPECRWYLNWNNYLFIATENTLKAFSGSTTVASIDIQANSNILAQEYFDSRASVNTSFMYFLISGTDGYLKFIKFDNNSFQTVEGAIQEIDPDNPDISAYNILNPYTGVDNTLANDVRDESDYTVISDLTAITKAYMAASQVYYLNENNILIVYATTTVIKLALFTYQSIAKSWLLKELSIDCDLSYTTDALSTKYIIYNNISKSYIELFIVEESEDSAVAKRLRIDITDTLAMSEIDSYTYPSAAAESSYYPLYNNKLLRLNGIDIEIYDFGTDTRLTSVPIEPLGTYNEAAIYLVYALARTKNTIDIVCQVSYRNASSGLALSYDYALYRYDYDTALVGGLVDTPRNNSAAYVNIHSCISGYDYAIFDVSYDTADERLSEVSIFIGSAGRKNILNLFNLDGYKILLSGNELTAATLTGANEIEYNVYNYDTEVITRYSSDIAISAGIKGYWRFKNTISVLPPSGYGEFYLNFNCNGIAYTYLSASGNTIYFNNTKVYSITSGWVSEEYKNIIITSDTSTTTSGGSTVNTNTLSSWLSIAANKEPATMALIADNGRTVFTAHKDSYTASVYKRAIAKKLLTVDRDASVIPVLTQLQDRPITNFYLANTYWFITEHYIFGTGAANGQLTIEFFDPMKYFAISESITAAIRLSDTSFWVFHNNGAYLIYRTATTDDDGNTIYSWLVTNTAKSKGCDFENAVITLPISSYIAVVTSDDVSTIQMKENIQSDERSLVPITLNLEALVRELLNETESIKIVNYRYLTIFFLNTSTNSESTPALVFDSNTNNWWYWEFPVSEVYQATKTETNVELLCKYGSHKYVYNLFSDWYSYSVASIEYDIYADRLIDNQTPTQIEWSWESAIQLFNTVDYRKQLLNTTFVFGEYNTRLNDGSMTNNELSFRHEFEIYADKYSERELSEETDIVIERAKNRMVPTVIASFTYLQLILKNTPFDPDISEYDMLCKPQICSISFKYRILPGGIT